MDSKEARLYIYILAITIVICFILVLYFISLLKYQKRLVNLYKEKISVELNTLERERNRFSKDLHDELGPQLSNIKLHLEVLELQRKENIELKTKLMKLVDNMLDHMRTISKNHNPEIIINDGLENAIIKMVSNLEIASSIKIKLDVQTTQLDKLLMPVQVNIYRIIQEAINNSIKHANCTIINIKITESVRNIQFILADNGKGFIVENELEKPSGMGISNIKSRVDIMGSEFNIYSDTKNGTIINFTISKNA